MEFTYKNRKFFLGELKEIGRKATYDIVVIFEDIEDESPKMIDFFFGVDEEKKELIKTAKYYIDKKGKGE